jgi:hypothetical protein
MTEPQDIKLFSKAQVSLATFLGAPISGALLMRMNYKALGHTKAAQQSLAVGIAGTVILLVIAFFLPDNFPNLVLPIASLFAVQQWYKQAQEETFKTHVANGGKKGSWGTAIGISLLLLVAILAVIFGVVMLLPENMIE